MTGKAILYRRFSSDEQESGDSLTRQLRTCEAFAAAKGWTIVERLDDDGYSGFKNEHMDYGELGRLTNRIKAGEVESGTIILAEKMDRLSRIDGRDQMRWIWDLTDLGVLIALADTGIIYDDETNVGNDIVGFITGDQSNQESYTLFIQVSVKSFMQIRSSSSECEFQNLSKKVLQL